MMERGELVVDAEKWARELADVIRLWCGENGYQPMNLLAQELKIPEKTWSTVMQGRSVVKDVTIYARLFVKTGRSEADPRLIPPRKRFIPANRGWMSDPRNWSEEQWHQWYATVDPNGSNEEPEAPLQGAPRVLSPPTDLAPSQTTDILSTLLDLVASKVAAGLEPRLIEQSEILGEILQALRTNKQRTGEDLSRLLNNVLSILQSAAVGTKEDRDAISRKHRKLLGDLFPLIEAFTFDPPERDSYLANVRTISL